MAYVALSVGSKSDVAVVDIYDRARGIVELGKKKILYCVAYGIHNKEKVVPDWIKVTTKEINGSLVPTTETILTRDETVVTQDSRISVKRYGVRWILTITAVKHSDLGVYKCQGNTTRGMLSEYVNLKVKGKENGSNGLENCKNKINSCEYGKICFDGWTQKGIRDGFCGTKDCDQKSDCKSVGNDLYGFYNAIDCIDYKCEYRNYRVWHGKKCTTQEEFFNRQC